MGQGKTVCLAGHMATGKTATLTAWLKQAGIRDEIVLDASQEEKERGHTLDLRCAAYESSGTRFTLLDTPGGDEFSEEMIKAVSVADLTLLVVHGEKGVEVATERAWEISGGGGRSTAVFLTHLDSENVDLAKVVAEMDDRLGAKFVPLQLPIREEGAFTGVVDLASGQAVRFADKSNKDVPAELADDVETWRARLLEEVSAADDELMMKFLEDEEITQDETVAALATGVADGKVFPVLCGVPSDGKGIDLLRKAVEGLTPTPDDGGGAARAIVFNLDNDPYLGRLSYLRVLAGTVQEGKALVDIGTERKVEIRDLYAFDGTKQKRVSEAGWGEVVALGKAEELTIGATLAAAAGGEAYAMIPFPKPVYSRTIVPKSQSDVEKMSAALKELSTAKATVDVVRDPVTKEQILWGMGDVHLGVFVERLKNRYNVALDTHRPRIPYKETIRKKAEAKYRHKKQTGGRGQFGEVVLRIEPLADEEFRFIDEIKGASIPGQYIPGVEKGVIEAMEAGNLAHYPVTNVAAAVFDGSFHPVDSSELAFKLAARNAVRAAYDDASPVILEPVMAIDVRIPEEHTGEVVSDLNGRRGRILGMDPEGRVTTVRAEVPLAEVQSYALDLKSLTQARGTFQMQFLKYQAVPGNLQEKVIAEAARDEE
ncbi:MAG: elongation factor G [Candidatus Bipolaricaulota bacterium]|nr:MAG: elongation factor G [Candidatus Bipolaricaulota bacterium]